MEKVLSFLCLSFLLAPAWSAPAQIPPASESWRWQSATLEDFRKSLFPSSSLFAPRPEELPQDHALTIRLQGWLDRLHALLMKERGFTIPRPIIRIQMAKEANGFVAAMPACSGRAAEVEGAPVSQDRVKLAIIANIASVGDETGRGMRVYETPGSCMSRSENAFAGFMRYLADLRAPCRLQQSNGVDSIRLSKECVDSARPVAKAQEIGYMATANVVTINSELIRRTRTEAELLGVLLHEAAHYYGAHGSSGRNNQLRFFYDQNHVANASERPLQDAGLGRLGEAALSAGEAYRARRIQGQQLHSAIAIQFRRFVSRYFGDQVYSFELVCLGDNPRYAEYRKSNPGVCAFKDALEAFCERDSTCYQTCGDFFKRHRDFDFLAAVRGAGGEAEPVLDERYVQAERELLACASTLKIDGRYFHAQYVESIYGALAPGQVITPSKIPTFAAYLKAKSDLYRRNERVITESIRRKMGYHTEEQEADVMSVHFAFLLGVDPEDFGRLYLRSLYDEDKVLQENEKWLLEPLAHVGYADCRVLREHGWSDQNGPVVLPVGSFFASHNASCFRVRNVDLATRSLRPLYPRLSPDATLGNYKWRKLIRDLTMTQ